MYITIDHASQFRDQFHRAGRGDQFSYEGLGILFDYLEEIDPDYDLDVIALCCEYSEASYAEIAEMYDIDLNGVHEDKMSEVIMDYLSDNTAIVGETNSGFIYQQF
jgi:hypothetical protein